jgi:hypothetical protein
LDWRASVADRPEETPSAHEQPDEASVRQEAEEEQSTRPGPERLDTIIFARFIRPRRLELALSAAADKVTVGDDELSHQVELRDSDTEDAARRAELRVRLRGSRAWVRPVRGAPLRFAGSEAELPRDRFTPIPIGGPENGESALREGQDLLAELRRVLEWA